MQIRIKRMKGQAIASDFVISLALFLLLLAGSAIIWNTVTAKYGQFGDNKFMQEKAFSITDALVRTEGYPPGWDSTSVKLAGLSEGESNILDKDKLLEFKNVDPDYLKSIWGIGGYNYSISITNSSGDVIVLDGTVLEYGTPATQKKDLVPLKRLVLINDSGNLKRAALTFAIWRQ